MSRTVAEAMVTLPKTASARITVAQARAGLADPKVHLLLLLRDGRLDTTLTRADLATARDHEPARRHGTTVGRVTGPTVPLAEAVSWMRRSGTRRLAVVAGDDRLVGLLCLKADGSGLCSDAGVLARAAERRGAC